MNLALIKYALANMRARKMRSFLTIISVMIGIAAITTLVSFGYGISSYVEKISQQMGNDKLLIQPRGFGFGAPPIDSNVRLNDDDVRIVEGVHGVDEATGIHITSGEVEFNNQKEYAYVMGADFKDHSKLFHEVFTLRLLEGEELRGREKAKAVLGYAYRVKEGIFNNPVRLHSKVKVNSQDIKVAGFYEEIGNPHDDINIYMNKEAVEELFGASNYQFVLVRSSPGQNPAKLADDIREELRSHRGQTRGNEDFFVQTFEQVIATFTSILTAITAVVILIAFISLLVAAVNIMNTMYAAILERTREIGVFKAIGARNSNILLIFIMEAGLLSLIGGMVGSAVGYSVASYAGRIISSAGYAVFTPVFPWQLMGGSLLFAFLVGITAGFLPAYRASKLNPIDALRYE